MIELKVIFVPCLASKICTYKQEVIELKSPLYHPLQAKYKIDGEFDKVKLNLMRYIHNKSFCVCFSFLSFLKVYPEHSYNYMNSEVIQNAHA